MFIGFFYQLLWPFAARLLPHYLRRRARLSPAYAQHWPERFGAPYPQPLKNAIWIHAVSVGETRAAAPLIEALKHYFPDKPLLITQMTPTGRLTAQQLYPEAQCRYLPYDKKNWVQQFIQDHQPHLGILMETEIWPNLMHQCAQAQIPLFLVNARLSAKSERGYLKVRPLIAPALATLQGCYAQTEADAQRLKNIGATHIQVCGSTKYDITPPAAMHTLAQTFKQRIGARSVVVCASTRADKNQDEAALLLQAWQKHAASASTLLVIIPRHPERFDRTAALARSMGFKVQKRSDEQTIAADTQVWIGDSMGELFAYYLCADVAFVGGSLVDTGCQNLIEPLACGVPTLFGPFVYNFSQTAASAQINGAARQIANADEWAHTTLELLQAPQQRTHMATQAASMIQQHQGAGQRMAQAIFNQLQSV